MIEKLNYEQNIRLQLVKSLRDVSQAQRAYDFVINEQKKPQPENTSKEASDGVYIVYDKTPYLISEPFNGENSKENVYAVAFKFGPVSLMLHPRDIVDVKMTCDDPEPTVAITEYDIAVTDYDGKINTEGLVKRGLSFKDKLPFDHFIPSLGQLYIMFALKCRLNEALEYVGHDPLANTWYWSSTEFSAAGAWTLHFYDGDFSYTGKTNEYRVRPVSAFIPPSL